MPEPAAGVDQSSHREEGERGRTPERSGLDPPASAALESAAPHPAAPSERGRVGRGLVSVSISVSVSAAGGGGKVSVLLGIELDGDRVRLVVVDRRARVLLRREEPLASPVERWWETHPEERHRAVIGLIAAAVHAGELRPAEVAAIGICAAPALAFLDADFAPVPPRELPWEAADPAAHPGRPWSALAALLAAAPGAARRIGLVLDLVGFLRFRMSGALGIDLDFAWEGGHIRSPVDPASWSAPALEGIGLIPSQLPPIFPGTQRVSVIGEETMASTGLRRGTWICGGGAPRNTRLLFAGEPRPGRSIVRLLPSGAERWEVGPPPDRWTADALPSAMEGLFFHRRDAGGWDPREGDIAAGSEDAIFDWIPGEWTSGPGGLPQEPDDRSAHGGDTRAGPGAESTTSRGHGPDLSACPASLLVAEDAGAASAGTAILAGLGIGWWRDPRPIFRKRRPPRSLGERREEEVARAAAGPALGVEAALLAEEDQGVAGD